jgi:hypothetical protein
MKTTKPILFATFAFAAALCTMASAQTNPGTVETRIPAVITGGHTTDPRDHGRPVVLVASALGVAPEVFRDAFSRVKPAPAGERPDPAQVQLNKQTLLASLGPYGITNDRLDEVSNFYRYNGRDGGIWRHTPATVAATVRNGVVTGFTIVNAGAGYTSAPDISVPGQPGLKVKVTLSFGPDFASNGSLKEIQLADGQP